MIVFAQRATIRPHPTVYDGKSAAAAAAPVGRDSVVLCNRPRLNAAVIECEDSYRQGMFANSPHESFAGRPRGAEVGVPLPEEPTSEMLVMPRDECLRLLASHSFGRLAVAMDSPVIRPVNYVFDEPSQSVAFRTADGSKFHAMLINGNAAFEIDGIDPGSRTGWSVIIVGMAEEVTKPSELRRLERLGLEAWTPGRKAHWMRIRAWTVTGRRIVLAGDRVPARPT
jgi:uncharacterized protein